MSNMPQVGPLSAFLGKVSPEVPKLKWPKSDKDLIMTPQMCLGLTWKHIVLRIMGCQVTGGIGQSNLRKKQVLLSVYSPMILRVITCDYSYLSVRGNLSDLFWLFLPSSVEFCWSVEVCVCVCFLRVGVGVAGEVDCNSAKPEVWNLGFLVVHFTSSWEWSCLSWATGLKTWPW